jgi:uncharacterized protein CbrC (UPF0167 family)
VTRFGEHAVWLEFASDRFDHESELPPDANAGNRFYGRDVAEFVSDGLAARGFEASFFDEDWGWQAHAARADRTVLEVSVYHNPEEDPATQDEWALMVRSLRKERAFGLVTRFREIEIEADALSGLEDVFRDGGIALRRREAL